MIDLPALPLSVRRRLRELLLEQAHPLVLSFAGQWELCGVHGDAAWYGIDAGSAAERLDALRDLFVGLELDQQQVLPFVELANGRSVHLHLIPDAGDFHLLLLDAESARTAQREQQQLANEAVLAGHAKGKAIDALKHIRNELERQRSQLAEADALKGALIATLSHEFRTPLTAAFGRVRLLEQSAAADPALQRELLALRRSLVHLQVLAENLLEYGRGEAGGLLNPGAVDLEALAADCRAMIEPLAMAKGLDLRVLPAAAAAPPPQLDELRLRQILVNLLSNAVRYTAQGEVSLALRWDGRELEAEVADTGIGIAPEFQARIFQPFNAGGQSGSRGAGLGLSIVRRLVEQMHGTLALDSAPGRGSRFTLRLPGAAAASASAPGQGRLHGRAYVVDDDPDIAQLLELALVDLGLQVRCFDAAPVAIEAALAAPPDLLVLDMRLPGLSGPEAVYALRSRGCRSPVLMLSAHATAAARESALHAGADRYLTKPVDFAQFARVVREMLG